ncbi:MAG: aa3-type cytochrome c oxidase subunit IV [Candidatus Puniceispirillaceae bacterium]
MDTSNFDKQAHAHLNTYSNFMTGAKIVGALVILTLVVMAATLL